ncbi:hypothetical protein B0H19DRAFT_1137224 [Mycena capillaripes]|nr:hypothetical protein B0H19DRAFT_1137224 [Mycena capillaripes]
MPNQVPHDDDFFWTPELVNLSNQLWAMTSLVGAALCGAVLLVIGILALNPLCRPHLDRVSFRILVCALLANTVFGITNAIGGTFTGPTWACGFDIFLLQFTLETSSFLLFCIALNLQLVVVHHFNGQKMEKFYILGSILVSLALTVPPYVLKQYGWDPLLKDCWYSNDDPKERLAWQIGTQLFWTLLTVAGELVTTSTVVLYMIRHQLRRKRIQAESAASNIDLGSVLAEDDRVAHTHLYRNIILRIVAYPITSALINLTSVACGFHDTMQDGVHSWTDYRVLLLGDFMYGGRAICYALLATTDPALVRALRVFVQVVRRVDPSPTAVTHTLPNPIKFNTRPLSVDIELATVCENEEVEVVNGGDLPSKYSAPSVFNVQFGKPLVEADASPRQPVVEPPPRHRRRVRHLENTLSLQQEEFQRQL